MVVLAYVLIKLLLVSVTRKPEYAAALADEAELMLRDLAEDSVTVDPELTTTILAAAALALVSLFDLVFLGQLYIQLLVYLHENGYIRTLRLLVCNGCLCKLSTVEMEYFKEGDLVADGESSPDEQEESQVPEVPETEDATGKRKDNQGQEPVAQAEIANKENKNSGEVLH